LDYLPVTGASSRPSFFRSSEAAPAGEEEPGGLRVCSAVEVPASSPDDSVATGWVAPQAGSQAGFAREGSAAPQAGFAEARVWLPVDSEAKASVWFPAAVPAAAPAVQEVADSVSPPEVDSGFSPEEQNSEALVAVPALPAAEASAAAVRLDSQTMADLDSALAGWHLAALAFGPVVRAAAETVAADR